MIDAFRDTNIEVFDAANWAQGELTITIALMLDHRMKTWRAYIGVTSERMALRDRAAHVARHGAKMRRDEAAPYARRLRGEEQSYAYAD